MKHFCLIALCSLSMGLFASPKQEQSVTLLTDSIAQKKPYTFSDFFDALDLPCVVGVAINNNKLEKPGLITAFRLGWREHKNYGWFSYITYDFHIHDYVDTQLPNSNVRSGDLEYNEVGMSAGYRIPLVKNLRQFYQRPELKLMDFYFMLEPMVTMVTTKHVEPFQDGNEMVYNVVKDPMQVIPSAQLVAGFEIFACYNLSFYLETGLIQHFKPNSLEQYANERGIIKGPGRQGTIQLGLSMFFK